MTNSATPSESKKAPKKSKKKGPIRFEAIIPFFLILGLIVAYCTLFLDLHLRKGMEWLGTFANGAEVNIASLTTNFGEPSISISGIQMTNPEKPERNRVEVGKVQLKLLWDALLRAKIVIPLAEMGGIQVDTPRKSPGRVLPPSEDGIGSQIVERIKAELGESSMGDLAKLLQGFDPLKELKLEAKSLTSVKEIEAVRNQLGQKQEEWKKKLQDLPGSNEINALQSKITGFKLSQDPKQIPGQLKELEGLLSQTKASIQNVETLSQQLASETRMLSARVGQVDDWIKKDQDDLMSKLKLPSIDAKSISQEIFGDLVLSRFMAVQKQIETARRYMPPPSEDKVPVIQPRAVGAIYEFGRENTYPTLWLKEARFSTEGEFSALGGDVKGFLRDVASQPKQIGKPATFQISGDFPKQEITGVQIGGEIDHRVSPGVQRVRAKVGSFPISQLILSRSEGFLFGFQKALGSAAIEGQFSGGQFDFKMGSEFQKVEYQVESSSKILQQVLERVTRAVSPVRLEAGLAGNLQKFNFSLDSNLGSAIAQGLGAMFQETLQEARLKINGFVQGQVAEKKQALQAQAKQVEDQVRGQVEEKKAKLLAIRSQVEQRIDEQKKKVTAPQKKALDQLKKKLPKFR